MKKRFFKEAKKRADQLQLPGSHSSSLNPGDQEDVSAADYLAERIMNEKEEYNSAKSDKRSKDLKRKTIAKVASIAMTGTPKSLLQIRSDMEKGVPNLDSVELMDHLLGC